MRELRRNGSPLPEFETDADRTYMITTIRIHERFEIENKNFGQKNDRSLTEVLTKKNYDKVLPIIKYLPFRNCVPVKDELINIHFLCIKLHFSE